MRLLITTISMMVFGLVGCTKDSSSNGGGIPPIFHDTAQCPTQQTAPQLDEFTGIEKTKSGIVLRSNEGSAYDILIDGDLHSFTNADGQAVSYRGGCRDGGFALNGISGGHSVSVVLKMSADSYTVTTTNPDGPPSVEVYKMGGLGHSTPSPLQHFESGN